MRAFAIAVSLLVVSAVCEAQPAPVSKALLREWGETIDYGIDSQIVDIVKKIKESGETSLHGKLTAVLARSVNTELRKAILGLFTETQYAEAEPTAYAILADYENADADVLRAAVAYLAEVKSKRSLAVMLTLAEADDKVLAYSAIAALGRLGDQSVAAALLQKLRDPDVKPDRKPTIITALGDLKAASAVPELLRILGSREEERVWRMYAAEALGKIGDASAVPVLKKTLSENDPLLKGYVAAALGRFPLDEVMNTLMECLKDSNWKVRAAACQGLARPGAQAAVDILMYKVKNDPETPVKTEAVKALAAIGSAEGFSFLRSYLADIGKPFTERQFVFSTLLEKNPTAETAEAIERALKAEWSSRNGFVQWAAQKLSRTESPHLKKPLALLLDHPDAAVRIYAVRGIVTNRFADLKARIEKMRTDDPRANVREEAEAALEKW